MLKKATVAILSVILAVSLCACGQSNNTTENSVNVKSSQTETQSSSQSSVDMSVVSDDESSVQSSLNSSVSKSVNNVKISSIKFCNSNNINIVPDESAVVYFEVEGENTQNAKSLIEVVSNNTDITEITISKGSASNLYECNIKALSSGTSEIYVQAKDGSVKSEKRTVNVNNNVTTTKETEPNTEAEESSTKEVNTIELKKTVKITDVKGLTFDVPEDAVVKNDSSGDNSTIYYYMNDNRGTFMFYVYSSPITDEFNKSYSDEFIRGVMSADAYDSLLSDEETEICGKYCRKIECSGKILDTDYISCIYIFANNNMLYSILNAYPKEFGNVYQYEFQSMINSITLIDDTQTSRQEIEEKVLYNENNIKIVYKGISDSWIGKNINLYIENNSSKDVTIQVRDFSVNDYMVSPVFSSDVVSGKKVNDEIKILSDDLEDNAIDEIKKVEFKFHIFDDNWEDTIETNIIKIDF